MADDKKQRQPVDPWSQFMFGGNPEQPQQNQQQSSGTGGSSNQNSQTNDTINSLLGPFMTKDGNLDMNKLKGGMDQAMKMANSMGPALKKLGPIMDMFSKKK